MLTDVFHRVSCGIHSLLNLNFRKETVEEIGFYYLISELVLRFYIFWPLTVSSKMIKMLHV